MGIPLRLQDLTKRLAILRYRRAHVEQLEAKRRAEQELAIAKEVQFRLFPQRKPDLPMLDYAGVCVQARAVGGDYLRLSRG